ncbi:MAG: MBL fold metallo-hydrolase [Woeseiaceae bacterium]|nr:MBL fold metallo-hydrolase [Woeseiaceae bacterium]
MRRTALASLLLCASVATAQEGTISYESTELVPGIRMTIGVNSEGGFASGNLGSIVTDDFVVMIDDGMRGTAPAMVSHVSETVGRPVDFVLNTHYHGDHTGANAAFAEAGAVVISHHKLRERLLEDADSAGGEGGIPVLTFGDGVVLHLNDITAKIIHVPHAHTDGDAFVFVPELNVIFAGDLQFAGMFPFIDLNGGGSVEGFIHAQQMMASMADADTIIIPGHGSEPSSLAQLEADTAMLIDGYARVKALVDEGMSGDEVVAANPLADYAADFDWYFINAERMTQTFYTDLTSE